MQIKHKRHSLKNQIQFILIYITLFRGIAYGTEVVASFPLIRKRKIIFLSFYESLHVVKLTLTLLGNKQGSLLILVLFDDVVILEVQFIYISMKNSLFRSISIYLDKTFSNRFQSFFTIIWLISNAQSVK